MPIGISKRLAKPKMAAPHAPRSISCLANQVSASPTGCHSRPKITPRMTQRNAIRIGTSRMSVEEPQPVHQLRAVVPLPDHRGEQADEDAAEHARVLRNAVRRRLRDRVVHREGRQHPRYTRKPTTAANAVEPSAFLAKPIATPMQKSSGRPTVPSRIALPPLSRTLETLFQKSPCRYESSRLPRLTRSPAAGSTATGSWRLRPIFCRPETGPFHHFGCGTAAAVVLIGILPEHVTCGGRRTRLGPVTTDGRSPPRKAERR